MYKWGALLFIFAIVLRLIFLTTLPGEWYGDITILHNYVQAILTFQWPVSYQLSAGPLYHYLIAPLISLIGYSYLSYKLASVIVSLLGLVLMAWLGYLVEGRTLALTTLFVGACSSWYLIFSRLGNSQILIPVVTGATLGLVILGRQRRQRRWIVWGAIVAAAGLYVYPQTAIVPVLYLFLVVVFIFLPQPSWPLGRSIVVAAGIMAVLAIPITLTIIAQPENFVSGYVGSKFFSDNQPLPTLAAKFLVNMRDMLWMLHGRGDQVFRSNPPYLPHLDPISGVLFFIGILALALRPSQRPVLGMTLCSIVILVIPAAWPNLPTIEIPSASRTIGIVPLVYLLVARGLTALYALVASRFKRHGPTLAAVLVSVVCAGLLYLNLSRYFGVYADNLPYHNVAFGGRIGQAIDRLPPETQVFVIGCCWSDWAMPEQASIRYGVTTRQDIHFVEDAPAVCKGLKPQTATRVFFSPLDEQIVETLRACAPGGSLRTVLSEYDDTMYNEYAVEPTAR